ARRATDHARAGVGRAARGMSVRVRRRALVLVLAAALLVAAAVAIAARDDGGGATAIGDTRAVTLADPDGDGRLARAPGEPLRDRTVLAPAARLGRVLATFGQISDAHVRDEESPALVGFLDRLGGAFSPTFRPQESLTTQVLAAAVRSMNAARPGAVVVTGDLIDDDQPNEPSMAL